MTEKTYCQNCNDETKNNDAFCEDCHNLISTWEYDFCKIKNCMKLVHKSQSENDGICDDCWDEMIKMQEQEDYIRYNDDWNE